MMEIQENIPLGPKTTLRIGGDARFYAEIETKEDIEEAYKFGDTNNIPVVILGSGSNTIFADGTINALVIKIIASDVKINGNKVEVESGKNLAQLVNELSELDLDLSPLTGIPGTVGGAVFGNAGQGCGGIWINEYVDSVCVFDGKEETKKAKDECCFGYRTSVFKNMCHAEESAKADVSKHEEKQTNILRDAPALRSGAPQDDTIDTSKSIIIWSVKLNIPTKPKEEIKSDIENLLQKRIASQPHKRTAGSCFLSVDKETPAWKLIEAAGLRGKQIGGIKISEKHSNFLENTEGATFEDAKNLIAEIKSKIDQPLPVEMRLIDNDGEIIN